MGSSGLFGGAGFGFNDSRAGNHGHIDGAEYVMAEEQLKTKRCPHCSGSLGGGLTTMRSFANLAEARETRSDMMEHERVVRRNPNPTRHTIYKLEPGGTYRPLTAEEDPR